MTIGERIRIRREELGMTQDELAKKIGYKSRSSVNKIELDLYNLKQSKIKAIADALDTTPSYIMGWEELDEKENERISDELLACEYIQKCFGKDALVLLDKFYRLDKRDQGRIIERLDTLLEDEKYSAKERLRNA